MGGRRPPALVARIVRMTKRLPIFPLTGAVLFPGMQLPLHIFEPRYRALVKDALARDRRIGMIQPQRPVEGAPLFAVGCLGKIGCQFGLSLPLLPPGRLTRRITPGLAQ